MTLGMAIRLGQGIGIHVEDSQAENGDVKTTVSQELRRRTWYSMYVLDRLLSLQLGRPPAIRNRDCSVRLPSRIDDSEFDLVLNQVRKGTNRESSTGDYFIHVIKFSMIIGHVIRDIYRPFMTDYSDDMLARTDRLDAELLEWRKQLPRSLRFDRGHTFESSAVLRRQRNMLATKFHHLRALIHRPYLCLPWLRRNDSSIGSLLERQSQRVVYSERICVEEAQATARMLNDVTDTKSLVEDFPWWQMISCLICASSILLVRRVFAFSATVEEKWEREILEEDADTCLKVFDALSTNSDAARRARDMLQSLRVSNSSLFSAPDMGSGVDGGSFPPASTLYPVSDNYSATLNYEPNGDLDGVSDMWSWQDWPSEIADSMTWSSQFVATLDPAVLSEPSHACV